MIDLLKETELEYIRCFSEENKERHISKFRDKKFKDSYANNINVLIHELNEEELISIINSEIENSLKLGEEFLNFEVHGNVDNSIIRKFKIKPTRVDCLTYMALEVSKYDALKKNNCKVKEVSSSKELDDIMDINIKDYAPIVGRAYATKRINRKINVYKNSENNLKSIICYYGEIAVGSCELLEYKNVVKVEDFGILANYQKKGFGSSILRHIAEKSYLDNKDIVYVITENNSLSERIYAKLGFMKIANKTQIIFDF